MTLENAIKRCEKPKWRTLYSGICKACKKLFYTTAIGFFQKQFFCSQKCSTETNKNKELISCFVCNKKRWKRPEQIKQSKSGKLFCSRKCFSKYITGKNSPLWKGGHINKYGYRKIYKNGKQIHEHRYIFENYIGRKLKPFENVHHLNGQRADNRIENLELWCKPQAIGQRVSDLVHFICKYYPKETKKELFKQ